MCLPPISGRARSSPALDAVSWYDSFWNAKPQPPTNDIEMRFHVALWYRQLLIHWYMIYLKMWNYHFHYRISLHLNVKVTACPHDFVKVPPIFGACPCDSHWLMLSRLFDTDFSAADRCRSWASTFDSEHRLPGFTARLKNFCCRDYVP